MKKKIVAAFLLGLLVMFFSCQSGKEDTDQALGPAFESELSFQSADTIPPVIYITSPTGTGSYATTKSSVILAGYASDNSGIKVVSWKNLKNDKKGKASGTTEWTTPAIPLGNGDNIIKITATDLAGNKTIAQIIVTRNTKVEFLSSLQATPDGIFVNTLTPVIFRIAIKKNAKLDANSVKVIKLNEKNKPSGVLVSLYDDGNVVNGDDIAGDGVFSGTAQLLEFIEGKIKLRVIAKVKTKTGAVNVYSEISEFLVANHISDEEFNQAVQMSEDTQAKYDELLATHSEEEAKALTVSWLKSQAAISEAGISESGNGIWYSLDSGILGGILLNPEGTKGGRPGGPPKRPLIDRDLNYKPNREPSGPKDSAGSKLLAEPKPVIGSKKAIVISPFDWQFNSIVYSEVRDMLDGSTCPDFEVGPRIYNADATVEVFKTLSNYGIVILDTHGDAFFNLDLHKTNKWLDDIFATPFGKVVFLTGEKATEASKSNYELDLKTGRLVIISGWYAITPAFIKHYNQAFPDSLIYNGSCRSMFNNSMGSAFLSNGAKVYYGYSEYVAVSYDNAIVRTLFQALVKKGKTAKEAFDEAVATHGASHGKAYFKMLGEEDLTVGKAEVVNGGFELGNKNGWSGAGDARIISHLGPLDATEGKYMAIISTGLGSVGDSNSSLYQSFCIPVGTTWLSFDYNVVSEEPMEWVGSQFDDKFEASLITSNGTYQLAYETINTSNWIEVDGIDFDGGDITTFETGWTHILYDVSAFATGDCSVTLMFHTWDVGDSIYDTAALIDNVKLE